MFDAAPEPETLKVGGKSAGHLRAYLYHGRNGLFGDAIDLGAFVVAIAYGLLFLSRPPSPLKTVVKTLPVALLALVAVLDQGPILLVVALALSALGDAFLAGEPKRWLPFGLASFLAAHLAYVALFVTSIVGGLAHVHPGGPHDEAYTMGPATIGTMAIAALGAIGMLWWLWRDLGALRLAVAAYVAAIRARVCTSLALPYQYAPAPLGALLFFASDAILSIQLFKHRFEGRLGQWAVWSFYFLGQYLIAAGFSPLTF